MDFISQPSGRLKTEVLNHEKSRRQLNLKEFLCRCFHNDCYFETPATEINSVPFLNLKLTSNFNCVFLFTLIGKKSMFAQQL